MRPNSDISKDCLLRNLKNGIEVVLSTEGHEVAVESSLVKCVAEVLSHGLRHSTVEFWQVVKQVTHSRLADSLAWGPFAPRTPASDHVQGLLWIYYTLIEGSLSSYVRCLISDKRLVHKHYHEKALLRDCVASAKFIGLLTSLVHIDITPVDLTAPVEPNLEIPLVDNTDFFVFDGQTSLLASPLSPGSSLTDSGLPDTSLDTLNLSSPEEQAKEMEGPVSERTLTPVDAELPTLDEKSLVDVPLDKRDPLFGDCQLSSVADDNRVTSVVKRKRGREGREKKRVSFHETVVGDGPKATVWERRSCDVETILGGWWTSFTSSDPSEKGEDALDMERGVPEGSDDPHLLYVETATAALKTDMSLAPPTTPKRPEVEQPRHQKLPWKTSSPMMVPTKSHRNVNTSLRHISRPAHILTLCPKRPPIDTSDSNTGYNQLSLHFEKIKPDFTTMEKLFNCTVYKVYRMLDLRGDSLYFVLTKSELCSLSLTKEHNLNMQRIQYRDLKYVQVGPCDEQISLEGGRKFICGSRGGELCAWLFYAVYKETGKMLNFPRIDATDLLRNVTNDNNCEDVLFCSWAIVSNEVGTPSELSLSDHLMFSIGTFRRFWEPAIVEIREGELLLKPTTRGSRSLKLLLDECVSCERLFTSRTLTNKKDHRPHTFCLRFEKKSPKDVLVLCLAAPDDRSVSNWMEVILKQCKGGWKEYHETGKTRGIDGHLVMVTLQSVLLLTAGPPDEGKSDLKSNRSRLVSRTSVQHVSALLTGPAYLILELDCHEVEDKASDWLLYFLSEEIKLSFVEFLIKLKPQLKSMVFDHKSVSCSWSKCENQSRELESRFEPLRNYLNSITAV